jgi:hypothetical protein
LCLLEGTLVEIDPNVVKMCKFDRCTTLVEGGKEPATPATVV